MGGVLAPFGGEIVCVNDHVMTKPDLVNFSPYTDAWLVAMRPDDPRARVCVVRLAGTARARGRRSWFSDCVSGRYDDRSSSEGWQGAVAKTARKVDMTDSSAIPCTPAPPKTPREGDRTWGGRRTSGSTRRIRPTSRAIC